MTILALEFSAEQRSVAVARSGSAFGEAVVTGGRGVAAFGMIEKVLTGAGLEREQIDTIAVGLGPGSYTGIRAAIALAEGWKIVRDINLIGVSSVEAIVSVAQAEKISGPVSVVVNAQREEFYCATYDITETGWTEVAALKILSRAEVLEVSQGRLIIGPEAAKFTNGRLLFPNAVAVAKLATGRPQNDRLEPIYLRETSFVKAKR
jgi:tRNA threonylcarbamoyladenosine biosynthesis protein TsaB